MENLPKLIELGSALDPRGKIVFANNFSFDSIKRFYLIESASTEIVRAWHGHMKEEKFAFVISGSALIAAAPLSDTKAPDKNVEVKKFVLKASQPQILHIPSKYANGIRTLEPGTKVMFFSTSTLDESRADDFRFPPDYFGIQIWQI